ncbi:hypothetical protein Avbf_13686, partial [Armadillidium vulgare]
MRPTVYEKESYLLSRQTFPETFAVVFNIEPNADRSAPIMLNLSNKIPTVLSFDIKPIIDNTSVHNYTIYGCLNVNMRPSIEYVNGTVSCDRGKLLQVNSCHPFYSNYLLIPYPQPGRWFYTLFPICSLSNPSNLVPCSTNVTNVTIRIALTPCIMGAMWQIRRLLI